MPSARWCEQCFHPLDPDERDFVEAYKTIGDSERKVYFHIRCFKPGDPAYLDAAEVRSAGRLPPASPYPSSAPPEKRVRPRKRRVRRFETSSRKRRNSRR
jgi:hypothetical protein